MKTAVCSFPRRLLRLLLGLFAISASLWLGAPAVKAAPRIPLGAFLRAPAPTVEALNRQIRNDPLVCTRYARLFKMSPAMIRAAFAHMRLSRMPEDRILQVHYVHPGERISARLRRVRKGTRVYLLADGTPALVQVCGNPVRAVLPSTRSVPYPVTGKPSIIPDFVENEEMQPLGAPGPAAPLRSAAPVGGLEEIAETLSPEHLPATPAVPPAALAPIATSQIGHFVNPVGLLLIPAAAGLLASGGGSSGSAAPPIVGPPIITPPVVTPPVTTPPITTPPVVTPPVVVPPIHVTGGGVSATPEPGAIVSFVSLALAGVAVAVRRRRW